MVLGLKTLLLVKATSFCITKLLKNLNFKVKLWEFFKSDVVAGAMVTPLFNYIRVFIARVCEAPNLSF